MFTSTFAVGPQRWALDPGVLRPWIDSYVADLASRGYEAATIHHLEHRPDTSATGSTIQASQSRRRTTTSSSGLLNIDAVVPGTERLKS